MQEWAQVNDSPSPLGSDCGTIDMLRRVSSTLLRQSSTIKRGTDVPVAMLASRVPSIKDVKNSLASAQRDSKYLPDVQTDGYSLAPTNKGEAVVTSVDKLLNWARAGAVPCRAAAGVR